MSKTVEKPAKPIRSNLSYDEALIFKLTIAAICRSKS